ncbi:hypothetical protein HPB48_015675 [Haemaphysalis longicornis]|uniref:PiggyBac transposable element-derived protein domain-containing protein n=1 Tax=Haemaphysalis longicornis TaxID=44386 RepID=A0A9J6FYA8_HAELO|nr:hypothetical protein HPB48_015675 [Haemaphysalis longicornis]
MDPARFYGTSVPPVDDSEDSCLSDSDSEYRPYLEPSAPTEESGSDAEDEDDVEETSTPSGRSFRWKQVTHPRSYLPQWEDSLPDPPDEPKAPIEYFRYFFDDEVLDAIAEQSNLFAIQKNANKALCLTCSQLEQFLSTTIYISIYSLPRSRMYWSHET